MPTVDLSDVLKFDILDSGVYRFQIKAATDYISETKKSPGTKLLLKCIQDPYTGYGFSPVVWWAMTSMLQELLVAVDVPMPEKAEDRKAISWENADMEGKEILVEIEKTSFLKDKDDPSSLQWKNEVKHIFHV